MTGATLAGMTRGRRALALAAACLATVCTAALAVAQGAPDALRSRIAPPDEEVLQAYRDSGVPNPTPHTLTDDEWAKVDAAIGALPGLHRRVLQQHLRRLSFVDVPPGGGNALTRVVDLKAAQKQFDITFRAGLLHETLTEFLNGKESGVF